MDWIYRYGIPTSIPFWYFSANKDYGRKKARDPRRTAGPVCGGVGGGSGWRVVAKKGEPKPALPFVDKARSALAGVDL